MTPMAQAVIRKVQIYPAHHSLRDLGQLQKLIELVVDGLWAVALN